MSRQATLSNQLTTVTLLYDGEGNRVRKTVSTATNSVTTYYLVDELNPTGYAQVLEELSPGAEPETLTVTRVYTYGHTRISQDRLQGAQWISSFYGYDGHNNVRYLTASTGEVTDTYDYDAFGNLIARVGDTPNQYLFTGEQFDAELGLYYLRARYHNADTGRFWTMDTYKGSSSDPGSLHKYLYAENNPINRADPSGNLSLLQVTGAVDEWAITFAVQAPRAFRFITFAAEMLVPAEVSVALPGGTALGGAALFAYTAGKELQSMRLLYERRGGFCKLGTDFENWVGKVLNLEKSNLRVFGGEEAGKEIKEGYAVIDYFFQGSILEVKLSGSALKEGQAKQLAVYAKDNGLGLTYLFMNKPSAEELRDLQKWVRQSAPNVDLEYNYLYK